LSCWLAARLLSVEALGSGLMAGLEAVYRRLFALPIAKGWVLP